VKPATQGSDEGRIQFNRDHAGTRACECIGEAAGSRSDVDDKVLRTDSSLRDDLVSELVAAEKVLTARPRLVRS
jgi:hypothetical protein